MRFFLVSALVLSLSLPLSSFALTLTQNLSLGSSGPQVSSLQEFLRDTKDFTHPRITGFYGTVTQVAVQKYQCRVLKLCSGTPSTNGYGNVGPKTRASMNTGESGGTTTPPPQTTTTTPVSPPVITQTLSFGMTNNEVRLLQEYLKSTGDYTYPTITGFYGTATEDAVKRYQARKGIVSSGTPSTTGYGAVGPSTRASISGTTAPSNTTSAPAYFQGTYIRPSSVPTQSAYTPGSPTAVLYASPSQVTPGQSALVSWYTTNVTSCTASGDWSGPKGSEGTELLSNITQALQVMLTCTGPSGGTSASASVSLLTPQSPVTPVPPAYTQGSYSPTYAQGSYQANSPAPSITFSASPVSVTSGGSTTLTWSSTNATSCAASGTSNWTGIRGQAGQSTQGNLTTNTAFNLSCTGSGGTAQKSVTVTVSTPTYTQGGYAPAGGGSVTLQSSGPVSASANGQIIENLRITSSSADAAVVINGKSNVIVRNVEIFHSDGRGIKIENAPGTRIENVRIVHTGAPASGPNPNDQRLNISCLFSADVVITRAKLEKGSSGAYLDRCDRARLSFIEGHDFRGPFPRGQLVQFNNSHNSSLEDFSSENGATSYPEDNVSVFDSNNVTLRRGLVDGNNAPSGVGIMFEMTSGNVSGGLAEDIDAVRQGNGAFSGYPARNVTFRRTRARDNICTNQGRGAPLSNALSWAGEPSSSNLRVEDSVYASLCNNNIIWDGNVFTVKDIRQENFTARSPIRLVFPWEPSASPSGTAYSQGAYYTQGSYYSQGSYAPSYSQGSYTPSSPSGGSVGPRVPVGPQQSITCPAGATQINTGNFGAVASSPGGTTFCFAPGIYAGASVSPKSGDRYFGQYGAIFDGQGGTPFAFSSGASNVTIRNFVIRNYNPGLQKGAVDNRKNGSGNNWAVENNEIAYNGGSGIEFEGGSKVIANYLHHNKQNGYACAGDNNVMSDNEIAHNNPNDEVDWGWEAGGGKCWATTNMVISYNYSHDNHGPGLWDDNDNHNITYAYNRVENNWASGIMHEIGYDAKMYGNELKGNSTSDARYCHGWLWCPEILISSSGGVGNGTVEIYNNKITSTGSRKGNAIGLIQQGRGSGNRGAYVVRNILVHDNVIDLTDGGAVGAVQDIGSNAIYTSNNRFYNNTYIAPKGNSFWWDGGTGDLNWFKSKGQEP